MQVCCNGHTYTLILTFLYCWLVNMTQWDFLRCFFANDFLKRCFYYMALKKWESINQNCKFVFLKLPIQHPNSRTQTNWTATITFLDKFAAINRAVFSSVVKGQPKVGFYVDGLRGTMDIGGTELNSPLFSLFQNSTVTLWFSSPLNLFTVFSFAWLLIWLHNFCKVHVVDSNISI